MGRVQQLLREAQECNSDLIFHNTLLVYLYFPLNSTLLTSTWTENNVIISNFQCESH
jgi:hypothetical protein